MEGDDEDGDDWGCDDQRREDEKLWIKMIFVKKGQLDIFVKVTSTWFVSIYILLVYIVGIYCWHLYISTWFVGI